jgi:hypothetical protein
VHILVEQTQNFGIEITSRFSLHAKPSLRLGQCPPFVCPLCLPANLSSSGAACRPSPNVQPFIQFRAGCGRSDDYLGYSRFPGGIKV